MPSHRVNIALLYLLLGTLTWNMYSCGQHASIPNATDLSLNLLVITDGAVRLKREGWADFHPTAMGAILHRGDLLHPAKGAKVVVLCNDLTTWTVPSGTPAGLANGCPASSAAILMQGESMIGTTRGWNDPLIPYIISPRKTSLLNDKPWLRWNAVPGATRYTYVCVGKASTGRLPSRKPPSFTQASRS